MQSSTNFFRKAARKLWSIPQRPAPAEQQAAPNPVPLAPVEPTLRNWPSDQENLPWFDQPDALERLEQQRQAKTLNEEDYQLLHHWCTEGYCVIPGLIPDELIQEMNSDFDALWTQDKALQDLTLSGLYLNQTSVNLSHAQLLEIDPPQRLQLRNHPGWRVHGFHQFSHSANRICNFPQLLRATSLIFDRTSVPQASLSFVWGSRQPIHQDTAVFHVFPRDYIIGAWVACEDITPESGPLTFYPKSHLEPLFQAFSNYPQTNLKTADQQTMQAYQPYIDDLCQKYERKTFIAKKGDVLLWHGMLLHGGSDIQDPTRTRRSFVVHYMPEGADVSNQVVGPFNW